MIRRRYYMYELNVVLMALGYDDVNERNAAEVARYMTNEILQGIVNNDIDHGVSGGAGIPTRGTVIGWSSWWVKACQNEIENRIDGLIL